jgi:hypothetical protein
MLIEAFLSGARRVFKLNSTCKENFGVETIIHTKNFFAALGQTSD